MSDIAENLLDNYGTCDRETDCYWGRDAWGRFNGCLKTGWIGRSCPHWHPLGATTYAELAHQIGMVIRDPADLRRRDDR